MRTWIVLAALVVAFGAGAIAVVLLASGSPGSPASETPRVEGAAPGALVPGPGRNEPGPPGVGLLTTVPGPPPVYGPPRPEAAAGTWEAVPPVARAAALGPLGAAVGRELNELQPQLEECFSEVSQARHGRDPVSRTRDYAPMDETGAVVLVLQLETEPGRVRIVDAPVEAQGNASDGLLSCAQRVLRGRSIPMPGANPGERRRLLYSLSQ